MKKKVTFGLLYNRKSRKISECTSPSLNGLSIGEAIHDPVFVSFFADVDGFSDKRLLEFFDLGLAVEKYFRSKTSSKTYILRIVRLNDDELRFECVLRYSKRNLFGISEFGNLYLIGALVIVAVVAGSLFTIFRLRNSMMEKKTEEANETVQTITAQIDNTISAEFDAWINELRFVGSSLSDYKTVKDNEDKIDLILSRFRDSLPFSDLGILLESGDLYFSSSRTYCISYEDVTQNLIINGDSVCLDVIDIGRTESVIFGIPLNTRNTSDKQAIAAVCGLSDISEINELLTVGAFNNRSTVAILKDDGFRIALSTNAPVKADTEYTNFFVDLKKQLGTKRAAETEADFLAGNKGMITLTYGDENYSVYYSLLSADGARHKANNGWHLMLYVPENTLFNSVNTMFQSILIVIIGILCVAILITILLVFVFLRKYGNDMMLKKQLIVSDMLGKAADKAVEASYAKTMFFSNMSHDIRTPINGIIGMTTIAMRHADDRAVVTDCLQKIDKTSSHLLLLINDVLDMSRIESKKVEINQNMINIEMVTEECKSIIFGQLANRKLDFICENKNVTHPDVLGDSLHLNQILINILGNSVKFTADGGRIDFVTEEKELSSDTVSFTFTVTDTGCGMTKEFIDHVFEPFSQENSGMRTNYEGTGLGLAIANQLTQLMGGRIDVQSEVGEGSCFRVTIPFRISKESVLAKDKKDVTGEVDFKRVRVLLVEDNELNRELATVLLGEAGMTVETAENGQQAVDAFLGHEPYYYHAILMDVMMPVMDGLAATRAIRASSAADAQTIPVIAMTANAFEEDIRKTHDAGMNAHLSKPIRIKEVLKVLASFVSVPKMQDPTAEGENADTDENEDINEDTDADMGTPADGSDTHTDMNAEADMNAADVNTGAGENADPNEISDVNENSDLSESTDMSENSDVSENADVSESSDVNESSDLSETTNVSESSDVSENPDMSENADVIESSDLRGNTESENPGNESPV